MENIHIRLRDELERLGLSMAEAARVIGEESSQGIRDVCSGRKRASAELVAKLSAAGADVLYILTGQRSNQATASAAIAAANQPKSAAAHRPPKSPEMNQLSESVKAYEIGASSINLDRLRMALTLTDEAASVQTLTLDQRANMALTFYQRLAP